MTITIHGGHNYHVPGAHSHLDEVNEDRKVVSEAIRLSGGKLIDCTDNAGTSQSANLRNLANSMNAKNADLNLSIHLNAGGGTGCECIIWPGSSCRPQATAISAAISNALGIRNRGVKENNGLYVLKHTKAPTIIVECAFVDSSNDANKWDATKVADAIVSALDIKEVAPTPTPSTGYVVSVTTDNLNVRASASASSAITTVVHRGDAYTIVEERMNGSTKWGRLKSGAGWISLKYTKRV